MFKNLETIKQETIRKFEETKDDLEELAKRCDHCFPVNDQNIGKLNEQSYENLKNIWHNLRILSRSSLYQEFCEQFKPILEGLKSSYLFLKAQYSL